MSDGTSAVLNEGNGWTFTASGRYKYENGKEIEYTNRAGVRELMKSPEMRTVLQGYGDAAISRLGEGYDAVPGDTSESVRAKVKVMATTYKTRMDNLKNNTILKAVGGGA